MGGENVGATSKPRSISVSSPHGRGKPRNRLRRPWCVRFIPARAGKTTTKKRSTPIKTAHPRAGGENSSAAHRNAVHVGSSPRGRGKRASAKVTTSLSRLIPARAGKTRSRVLRMLRGWAHPRAGGEDDSLPGCTSGWEGSSPRGRGKKLPMSRAIASAAAHPRAGGENFRSFNHVANAPGSSPRGRGKHCVKLCICLIVRLIPARAGKTVLTTYRLLPIRAHPRAGGENPP